MTAARTYSLTALTDIWTGDASCEGKRLISTGLLGSIRWWFEVVVRGLGGSACDPTHREDNEPGPCPQPGRGPHDAGHHCVVCELFGCTGWARKFRFDVRGASATTQQDQIEAGQTFQLRFTELRPIRDEEWALLDLTIRLIAEYAAIGGKTVFKPSDENNRQNAFHHKDFGLTKLEQVDPVAPSRTEEQLRRYVSDSRWRSVRDDAFAWASLQNFWCVKGRYLARQNANTSTFNRVIGRPEPKNQSHQRDSWLAGRRARPNQPAESKKVFSFKHPESESRTFGFVQSAEKVGGMKQRLREKAWNELEDDEFVTGPEILRRLLGQGGDA
jgi:CRISPR-associated protein Cmr1